MGTSQQKSQRITTDFPAEFLALFRQVVVPGTPGECWPWPHHIRPSGYGHFSALMCTAASHRTSFAAFKTDPPIDLVVRHKCDNPPCWNPDHLLLGTTADNMADAYERGRNAAGDSHGMAVLTSSSARELAQEYLDGHRMRDLVAKYRVSRATVSDVVRRKIWRPATEGLPLEENGRGYEFRRTSTCVTCEVSKVDHPERFKVFGTYGDGTVRLWHQCTPCRNADDRRWRAERRARETRTCETSGCGKVWFSSGLCRTHYNQRLADRKRAS